MIRIRQYKSIIAEPHTPPYKIHRYFARRPWNVFSQFSNPNEIILDPFMGGGVTVYEGLKLNRKIIGFDLNPLSVFIVKNMVKRFPNVSTLDEIYSKISNYVDFLYDDFEKVNAEKAQGILFPQEIPIEWNELAFIVYCNYCGAKVVLSNDNKVQNGRYSCPDPKCKGNKVNGFIQPKDCKRDGYLYLFSVINDPQTGKRIHIPFNEERLNRLKTHISFLKKELAKNNIEVLSEKIPLEWDRQLEDLLERKNIIYFKDLFTEKNLYINLLLKNFINKLDIDDKLHELFRLVFSSSLRDTNLMAFTNEAWQSGSPTTWSKHAYWIPSQFCEVNVKKSFERAFKRMRASIVHNNGFLYEVNFAKSINDVTNGTNIHLSSSSVTDSNLKENSVDAIITDPPYGSNVQYLELSHFWYVWNKDIYKQDEIDFTKEAVSNRKKNFKGAKSMYDYESNLSKVFNKCFKVLKPGKYMVLTFNNKDISAWLAIVISILRAGFSFEKLYFQEGVKNYKQTAHTKNEGSPYGDYIYVFKKPSEKKILSGNKLNEIEFNEKLDKVLSKHLKSFEKGKDNRDEIIKNMFIEAMPIIEEFVRSHLSTNETHTLYSFFNKRYMESIYG